MIKLLLHESKRRVGSPGVFITPGTYFIIFSGLAEVVGGLGVEKLHELMPDIIRTSERSDIAPHVKDGYIMMFIFMPAVFPDDFTTYIGQIISPILRALADENEFVRDTAYKAGQRIGKSSKYKMSSPNGAPKRVSARLVK